MNMFKKVGFVLLGFLSILPAFAAIIPENPQIVIDSLRQSLTFKTRSADSMMTLYHIYDLVPASERPAIARQLYNVAGRARKPSVQLDVLRELADDFYGNDSVLTVIRGAVSTFPESPEQVETMLFLKSISFSSQAVNATKNEVKERIDALIQEYKSNPPKNDADRYIELYRIAGYLAQSTQDELLNEYIAKLDSTLERIPNSTGILRNLFYNRSALAYSRGTNHVKAIEYDKRILRMIDSMERCDQKRGRIYKTYDMNRYKTYRRLLRNFHALKQSDIQDYYDSILLYVSRDPEVRDDFNKNQRALVYYKMATRQYEDAIKLINSHINDPDLMTMPYYNDFIQFLYDAARETGDKESERFAAEKLISNLKEFIESNVDDRSRELQIVYKVNELNEKNVKLELESKRAELHSNHAIIFVISCALVVLLFFIGLLYRQNRKNRKLAMSLRNANDELREERDNLEIAKKDLLEARDEADSAAHQKTEFINNMSHEINTPLNAIAEYSQLIVDCIPDNKRKYLDRFAGIIRLNVELVLRLVNDVLDIASLETGTMAVKKTPVSIASVCNFAIDSTSEMVAPGVKVLFNTTSQPDEIVPMDSVRVGQVLLNLMSNAAKFTTEGTIILDYFYNKEQKMLSFSVMDTGIGIPIAASETIFSRFKQLDKSTQGCGLGLYICKMIAQLLDGHIDLDQSYRHGARFVFSIPV